MSKKQTAAQYNTQGTRAVAEFLDAVGSATDAAGAHGAGGQAILDQVKNTPGVTVPQHLNEMLGRVTSGDEVRILDAIATGVRIYEQEHGTAPTADVVEAALQQGNTAMRGIDGSGRLLDSVATSDNHAQGSLQANRAVVATLSAIAEAIPFAAYLPVDIASNQAKLAILSHEAGSDYGDYTVGKIMDGVNVGDVFASSSRFIKIVHTGDVPYTGKFSETNLTGADAGYCNPAADGVPVLRGRTILYVNGKVAAMDSLNGNGASSPLTGSVDIAGTTHTITGTVAPATGVVTLTAVTPDFPVGTLVTVQGFVDYERVPALIPRVIVRASTYDLYANPWRVMTGISIDAQGQFRNELGLDANSEALMAIRAQMSMERHYMALRMARDLGINNAVNFDFDHASQKVEKVRAQIWQDFMPVLHDADQKMANATMDHGITHLYVSSWIAGQWSGLPDSMFVPSGISARPSIYRVGRLFNKYEVYYSPKLVQQSADMASSSIIGVGRSSQVARCPIVLGDAVSPTFLDLNLQSDLNKQSAMYARDFTVVNPHEPSALGCAQINITNLK